MGFSESLHADWFPKEPLLLRNIAPYRSIAESFRPKRSDATIGTCDHPREKLGETKCMS